MEAYLTVANNHTLLIALIEDIRAVENLDEILGVEPSTCFSSRHPSLPPRCGLIGQVAHTKVQETVDDVLRRIIAARRTAGTTLFGNQNGERYVAVGVRFLAATAQPWIATGIADLKRRIAEALAGIVSAVDSSPYWRAIPLLPCLVVEPS